MPSRRHRVTRGDEYRRTIRSGRRVGGAFCITHAVSRSRGQENRTQPARFGYIVSKAVGNAVTRNLVRRRLKTISERLIADGTVGVDIVIRALPASADVAYVDLEREVIHAVRRLQRSIGQHAEPS